MLGKLSVSTAAKKYGRQLGAHRARTEAGRAQLKNAAIANMSHFVAPLPKKPGSEAAIRNANPAVARTWKKLERVGTVQAVAKLGVLASMER